MSIVSFTNSPSFDSDGEVVSLRLGAVDATPVYKDLGCDNAHVQRSLHHSSLQNAACEVTLTDLHLGLIGRSTGWRKPEICRVIYIFTESYDSYCH